jgi:hypothetical protein
VVGFNFPAPLLEIELRWLAGSRECVMRALRRKTKPFRYLACVIKPNILRISLDMLDQLTPLTLSDTASSSKWEIKILLPG